jgi:hypothetical protein
MEVHLGILILSPSLSCGAQACVCLDGQMGPEETVHQGQVTEQAHTLHAWDIHLKITIVLESFRCHVFHVIQRMYETFKTGRHHRGEYDEQASDDGVQVAAESWK